MPDAQSEIMPHSTVSIFVESRYKVNRKRITSTVLRVLQEQQIVSSMEVSLAIVGDRKMRILNKKYRGKDATTNVLSFSLSEGKQMVLPPSSGKRKETGLIRLGDIVIAYPQVIREASKEDVLVDDKVDQLTAHAMMHLLGIHHEE